jgi:Sideroflexins
VNVAITEANANHSCSNHVTNEKSKESYWRDTMQAYTAAVGVSCSVAFLFNQLGLRSKQKWLARFAPFFAVAAANIANIYLIRKKELL